MGKNKMTINFWGIGAQKAGTTWLHYNLSKTQGFSIPPVKEFHYFDRDARYPSPNYLTTTKALDRIKKKSGFIETGKAIVKALISGKAKNVIFAIKWHFIDYSDEWYKSIFDLYKGIKGEITPAYAMLDKEDILRMHAIAPDAKLIFMLRNPIDRAWSHFRHIKKRIKGFSLENVEEREIISFMQSEGQVLRSDYIRTIRNFTSVFPKEQLLIGFYDAIIDSPEQLLEEVIDFIAIKESKAKSKKQKDGSSLNKVVNKSIEIDCPPQVLALLKEMYHDMILDLANKYGGYFNKWYCESYGKSSNSANDKLSPTILIE